ncbi:hypothetical protein [Phenylobacterium sp.]|jgi:hypothetical protein
MQRAPLQAQLSGPSRRRSYAAVTYRTILIHLDAAPEATIHVQIAAGP